MLETLVRSHPRLLIDATTAPRLRSLIADDPLVARMARDVCEAAEEVFRQPALVPDAARLRVSRACLERVQALGVAWLATGREDFATALRETALTACAFPVWGGRDDFLATAEMATAVALAYDWLHPLLSAGDRATLRAGLIAHALEPGLAAYDAKDWWVDTHINWNQVSNGGLILAALAIADDEPRFAAAILPRAITWLPIAFASLEPDGNCGEGAGYWSYAADYTAYLLSALTTALGHDFGLGDRPGLRETGTFALAVCGPTGLYANFADVVGDRNSDVISNRGRRGNTPVLLWYAQRYGRPEYARVEIAAIEAGAARPMDLLWYRPELRALAPHPPLAKRFGGECELACLRTAWDDRDALFVWLKAGYNQINHGHLDLGSFGLDALGQRWATDLGAERYSLPGYFEKKPGGRKWSYFRLNSESHNVPLIDGLSQDVLATATMTGFSDDVHRPFAIVDYASAYAPRATAARRGVMLLDRRAMVVQDEFQLPQPCRFTWGMTTDAAIALAGERAVLSSGGRTLTATIVEPTGARFTVASADRAPPERPNVGVSRLLIDLPRAQGEVRVVVRFDPQWPDDAPRPAFASPRPLAAWA